MHPARVPSARINPATEQQTMNTEPDNESGETMPLILRLLTPEEIKTNQAIADELLDYVFDGESIIKQPTD